MKRIVVTGGAGYVGHKLVPALLEAGYAVTVYDTLWFGWRLGKVFNGDLLKVVQGDIRDTPRLAVEFKGAWAVIHMACISNDPSFELDESLSRTINYEAFEPMVVAARTAGVERFIYASSSSVYGISDAPDVREDHPLVPITLYNTYKAKCEPILWKYPLMCSTVLRPSTICGYSPRQRLDLAVNILTNLAVNTGKILVHGGKQKRPNLHIDDMVSAYLAVLEAPVSKVWGRTFNVGATNQTIDELAELVKETVEGYIGKFGASIAIKHTNTVDHRSYQVNSDTIRDVLGFKPRWTVKDAICDLCAAFRNGKIPNAMTDDNYYNVKRMRAVWEDVYKNAPAMKFDPTKGHLSEIDLLHR